MLKRCHVLALMGALSVAGGVGFSSQPSFAQSINANQINEIVINGAQRIEPETVRSYLLIQEGDVFDERRIDKSLKTMFNTGLFADVSIKREGNALIVNVTENPVINRIAFEGNARINDETLEQEISMRPRVIYTRTRVLNDVERLLTLYRRSGRFAATVEPKVITLDQNRINLVFEINEGAVTGVESIRFVGNRKFSDGALKDIIRSKEKRWYRFLTSDDTYDPDRVTLDRELLRRYYLSHGFADFSVKSAVAELTPTRDSFNITYTIDEGKRYKFGTVDVDARLRDITPEELKAEIEIESDEWYDADLVEKTVDTLTTAVGNKGFAFVDIRPRVKRRTDENVIDISFEISEGNRVFVERININGNLRTLDEVVRREFRLVEGDAFNTSKLRRSRQRIVDLDFFDKVEVTQVPGSANDKTIINVDVQEKSTGSLSLGIGFSTTSGPLADFGVKERNLLGKGQTLNLDATIGAKKTDINLGFTEPYFMDREISAGVDLFRTTLDLQDTSSYDQRTVGGGFRFGYPITEDLRQSWRYVLKQNIIEDVDSTASRFIRDQEGKELVSLVGHTLSFDKRNSKIFPTEGYVLRLNNDIAGLGGTSHYFKNTFTAAKYFPLTDSTTLRISGVVGNVIGLGEDVKIQDRFFIGGDDLRGFESSGVGPRDRSTGDSLGGEWKYTGTTELTFPIGLPNEFQIKGKLFSDFGSSGTINPSDSTVQDVSNLRLSVGTGINWVSPFGPVGVDIGFPILKETFDKNETFRINFGTRF